MLAPEQSVRLQASESRSQDIETMQAHINALQAELSQLRNQQKHSHPKREEEAQEEDALKEDISAFSVPSETSTLRDILKTPEQCDQTSISSPRNNAEFDSRPAALEQSKVDEYLEQNTRLKEVISHMREELESLQESKADNCDVARLRAELKASDVDLEQANEHIEVLEKQIEGKNGAQSDNKELNFLRAKVGVNKPNLDLPCLWDEIAVVHNGPAVLLHSR